MEVSTFYAIVIILTILIIVIAYAYFRMTFLASLAIGFLVGMILIILLGIFNYSDLTSHRGYEKAQCLGMGTGVYTVIALIIFAIFIACYAPYAKRKCEPEFVFANTVV